MEAVNWTVLLSTAVLSMIPILIVFIVFNKQIMNANMSSGVRANRETAAEIKEQCEKQPLYNENQEEMIHEKDY